MTAEIISVGTEILLGDTLNSNAQYIAKELAVHGFSVYHQSVVGDHKERLRDTFLLALSRADIIITTGGLGPTQDDMTKEVICDCLNLPLHLNEEYLKKMKEYFQKQNYSMSENNVKQAFMPKGSKMLVNNNGTAPGLIIEKENHIIIMLPGPPREMNEIFQDSVIPYLRKFQKETLHSKVIKILGIGESSLEEMLKDVIEQQTNPTIALYAKKREIVVRLTAKAKNTAEAKRLIEPLKKEIYKRLEENIYGEDEETLEEMIFKLLEKNQLTLSVAESATGGMIASHLISYPGISSVFKEGIICYSNESKIKRLGVKAESLETFGAVSREVAREMAIGMKESAGTDIGLSTTGIAGPGGKTDQKDIGLMYIGLAMQDFVYVKELNLMGSREKIRNRTTLFAMDWLRRELIRL